MTDEGGQALTNESPGPPKAPKGLRKSGRNLWKEVVANLGLDRKDEVLLIEACRVTDRLDILDAVIRIEGEVLEDGRVHPALVESRQQQITLARLITALRLPEDLSEPTSRRPQRRGIRGVYHPRLAVVEGGNP